MKAIVTEVFVDKLTGQLHQVGEIVDFDDTDRVADLSARNLIQVAEEVPIKKVTRRVKK